MQMEMETVRAWPDMETALRNRNLGNSTGVSAITGGMPIVPSCQNLPKYIRA